MSYVPRLTYQEYQTNFQRLKREMGEEWEEWIKDQFAKLRIRVEPRTDEDRWTVWNALNREASLAFQERKLKEAR